MSSSRLRDRLRSLLSDERGIALPTAIFAMVAVLGLGGAAILSSVQVQQGSKRDSGSKSAIAAADAGVNVAVMRLNRDAVELDEGECLDGAAPTQGWCPPVAGTVGDAEYSYQVSAAGASASGCEFDLCLVATGSLDGVTRRVMVTFDSGPGGPPNGGGGNEEGNEESGGGGGGGVEGVIGVNSITIENNADARVNIGTNGNITVSNNGNICGHARHGIGKKLSMSNNAKQCPGYSVTEGNTTVPPVSSFMPSNLATVNANYKLARCTKTSPKKEPAGCQEAGTYTSTWSSTVPWNPTTRTLSTSNNATLTLSSGDYFVCKLELSNNSRLIMNSGALVRVFFDTPENCNLSSGTRQIYVANNANITATGYQPSQGKFEMPGFYLMGSTSRSTVVEWKNNSGTNEFVLYGPNTDIILQNNATYYGIIVGKTVHLNNNAVVKHDVGFLLPPTLTPWQTPPQDEEEEEPEVEVPPIFTPQYYVECTGSSGASPADNC